LIRAFIKSHQPAPKVHFELLRTHLKTLGHDYGDFEAHNGLWDMAMKTAHDPLVRMALVPRVLEARGLDVTPGMIKHVLAAIREVCGVREWTFVSANVRTNHVHVLVKARAAAEKVLGDFKRYATRRLRAEKLLDPKRPVWTDGGSTIYVWNRESFNRIDRYIRYGQGEDLGGRAEG